jgi:hypothetical protein
VSSTSDITQGVTDILVDDHDTRAVAPSAEDDLAIVLLDGATPVTERAI